MNNTSQLSLEGLTFQATKINIEENVLTVTLNRPEKKNALNNVMMNEICYALSYAKQEREIRVVVIAAEGDVFVQVQTSGEKKQNQMYLKLKAQMTSVYLLDIFINLLFARFKGLFMPAPCSWLQIAHMQLPLKKLSFQLLRY
jgi:1,4-dihydroxy-2-naphthoyl-CoA synthase